MSSGHPATHTLNLIPSVVLMTATDKIHAKEIRIAMLYFQYEHHVTLWCILHRCLVQMFIMNAVSLVMKHEHLYAGDGNGS